METAQEVDLSTSLSRFFIERLHMNEVIRFLLDTIPNEQRFQDLLTNETYKNLFQNSESCKLIDLAIHTLLENPTQLLETKEEYYRLFIGPNALPAPLWESVYLGREHAMFEEQTLQVRACYREHGLHYVRENNEPEDHLVIELEFLSYLIQETLASVDEDRTMKLLHDQISFYEEHLAKWVPQFSDILHQATASPLYQGTAQLVKEYMELEQEAINLLKEAIPYE